MVDMEFHISGKKEDIFDMGFRPGLAQLADEVGIKVHATNLRKDSKLRVIASGSHENIIAFHESIKQRIVPTVFRSESPDYNPDDMREYNGPDIDWDSYNLQFMSAQLSKTMIHSSKEFNSINDKLNKIYEELSSWPDG
jgi:acylphosphatase